MKIAGLDIGSRTIKLAVIENRQITSVIKAETGTTPRQQAMELLSTIQYDTLVATGYGRTLIQKNLECSVITEIKAFAKAVKFFYPQDKLILDIGGQDTKTILLDDFGNTKKFEMNDKCAAGTGKFLEIMALSLGVDLDKFGELALTSHQDLTINSTCTVFAESEVISLLAQGNYPNDIALAIHKSVASKALAMINRIGASEQRLIFAGGGSLNVALLKLLQGLSKKSILVHHQSQYFGAIGAALCAVKE